MHPKPLSAVAAVEQLNQGSISAAQILSQQQDKITQLNPEYNAFVHVPGQVGDLSARGVLKGLPISIKDQIHVAGMPCTSGYQKLRHFVPEQDAAVVADLKTAGGQILGKTNLPPLAMDFQTYNAIHGQTNNPWHKEYTAGGSSGGGATAVATGMSYAEIGTDLAGSLRIPASFCGVCSLMPSLDRVSTEGTMTLVEQAKVKIEYLPRVGPLAREVQDLQLIWQALSGELPVSKSVLNLALLPGHPGLPLHSQIQRALTAFKDNVARSDEVNVQFAAPEQFSWADAWQAYGIIQGHQFSAMANPVQRFIGRIMSRGAMRRSPNFIAPIQRGNRRKLGAYQQGLQQRLVLSNALDEFLQQYDAWVLPVTLVPAFKHIKASFENDFVRDYDHEFSVGGQKLNYFEALTRLTTPFNLTGHPVVTIPVGKDEQSGLPIGLQLVGKRNQDAQLLAVAYKIQQTLALDLYSTQPKGSVL